MAGQVEETAGVVDPGVRRLRVGLVCPYSFDAPGGVQAHVLDLARFLLERGHGVRVLGPCEDSTDVPEWVMRGGPSVSIPYNGSVARLSVGPRVRRVVRRFIAAGACIDGDCGPFDVLHIHEPNSPSYSLASLVLADGPIVATYHASSSRSLLLGAAAPALRPALEKIDAGIAVSEMARRWQVEQLGKDPILIPNGVDTAPYVAARQERGLDLGEGDRPVVISFLGRVDEARKGLQVAVEALKLLDAAPLGSAVIFRVMGGGEPVELPRFRQITVEMLGRVSEAEKIAGLASSDVYVAPNTHGESFGIVLVEAMAAGAAVVASDLEAFRAVGQVDSPEPAAATFATGDPADLARVLGEVLRDPQRRSRLRAAGQRRAAEFDWARVGRDIERVYQVVAAAGPVRVAGPRLSLGPVEQER